MATFSETYLNRRVGMMLPLGFAAGLPLALTGDTLAAWAKTSGASLTDIGLLTLVSLPYAIKFLWAPIVDRYALPFLDRRRSWLVLFQLSLIAAICAMGMFNPVTHGFPLVCLAVLVAFFSASQDICADAYRTDTLLESERGSGSAVFVGGYRLGMITSGGLALILAGRGMPWNLVYALMGLCMLVGVVATFFAPHAPAHIQAPASLDEAVVRPLQQIFTRQNGWMLVAFIIIFKLPELLADKYTTPFLLDLKVPLERIGSIRQTFGLAVTIVGTLAGGYLIGRVGLKKSLWIIGILQPITNLAFFTLNYAPGSRPLLIGVIGVESFVLGLVTAGFGAFLMSQCDRRYSAFQFALFSSLMAITRVVGIVPAGKFAQTFGWTAFFTLTIVVAIPGLILLAFMPLEQPQTQEDYLAEMPASADRD